MGLLDDAIREHLDLKRRRGADPAEIARAEHEALGPVRRGPDPAEASDLREPLGYEAGHEPLEYEPGYEHLELEGGEPLHHEGAEEPLGYEAGHDPLGYEQAPPGYEPATEPPAYENGHAAHPGDAGQPARWHEPFENKDSEPLPGAFPPPPAPTGQHDEPVEAAEPGAPPPHPAPGPRSDETIEYDVEAELGKQGEDVLEETPEFLQDAPEHDRLWFEQRPPRDFDFNE